MNRVFLQLSAKIPPAHALGETMLMLIEAETNKDKKKNEKKIKLFKTRIPEAHEQLANEALALIAG
jgi:hypothetical protein